LEDTKTDLGKLVEQIKNLEEKIAVIDDKENKRFDAFYEVIVYFFLLNMHFKFKGDANKFKYSSKD